MRRHPHLDRRADSQDSIDFPDAHSKDQGRKAQAHIVENTPERAGLTFHRKDNGDTMDPDSIPFFSAEEAPPVFLLDLPIGVMREGVIISTVASGYEIFAQVSRQRPDRCRLRPVIHAEDQNMHLIYPAFEDG
jgi:hypothetical protein